MAENPTSPKVNLLIGRIAENPTSPKVNLLIGRIADFMKVVKFFMKLHKPDLARSVPNFIYITERLKKLCPLNSCKKCAKLYLHN